MNTPDSFPSDLTLDPPGSIAVVGATAQGIETALYGRFLGFTVTLIEAVGIEHALSQTDDQPLPILPDRAISNLAQSALNAQRQDENRTLPATITDWIQQTLIPLTETDLLRGRLLMPATVQRITHVEIEEDGEHRDDDVPPDFRLFLETPNGPQTLDVEAVVLIRGSVSSIEFDFDLPAPYLFQIGQTAPTDDAEADLQLRMAEIVKLFAGMTGREQLDLYRPRRV